MTKNTLSIGLMHYKDIYQLSECIAAFTLKKTNKWSHHTEIVSSADAHIRISNGYVSYFRELAEEGPVIGCVCIWLAGVLFWFSHVVYVAIPHVIICLCLGKEIEQIKKNPKKATQPTYTICQHQCLYRPFEQTPSSTESPQYRTPIFHVILGRRSCLLNHTGRGWCWNTSHFGHLRPSDPGG